MHERDFWMRLEHRVSHELAGMGDRDVRSLWCDGLIAESYHLGDERPHITGRAWIGRGPREQTEWRFTLLLPQGVRSLELNDWSAMLPPDNVTRWLALDHHARHMEIDPAAAMADPA